MNAISSLSLYRTTHLLRLQHIHLKTSRSTSFQEHNELGIVFRAEGMKLTQTPGKFLISLSVFWFFISIRKHIHQMHIHVVRPIYALKPVFKRSGSISIQECIPVGCVPGRDVCPGVCLPTRRCLHARGGVSACRGGVHLSPWTDRQLWKHNFSSTTDADGKKTGQHIFRCRKFHSYNKGYSFIEA